MKPHPTDHAFAPDAEDVSMCGICGWEEVGDIDEALADLKALWKRVSRPGVRSIGTGFVEDRIEKAIKVLQAMKAPQGRGEPLGEPSKSSPSQAPEASA